MDITLLKKQAAERAVDNIQSGMVVGLGEGSTAVWAIRRIAELLDSGALTDIVGIPCSVNVESVARDLGIPLASLDDHAVVDLTIDGADEVDPQLNLIKGGGGALLREKMVAQGSQREVIVVDEGKLSDALGTLWPVPIEVVQFSWGATARYLRELGGNPVLRTQSDGTPFVTDQGNYILDTAFGPMDAPENIAAALESRAGIVEHGMFLGLADEVIVAGQDGIRHIKKSS